MTRAVQDPEKTVSVVAGDESVNGGVNPNGACLDTNSVAQVVFYEEPSAILSGGVVICEGESANLNIEFTNGIGPWTVELTAVLLGSVGSPSVRITGIPSQRDEI